MIDLYVLISTFYIQYSSGITSSWPSEGSPSPPLPKFSSLSSYASLTASLTLLVSCSCGGVWGHAITGSGKDSSSSYCSCSLLLSSLLLSSSCRLVTSAGASIGGFTGPASANISSAGASTGTCSLWKSAGATSTPSFASLESPIVGPTEDPSTSFIPPDRPLFPPGPLSPD